MKCFQSSQARNTSCTATIHIWLERKWLPFTHPLEINLKYTHNHITNSADVLSFRCIKKEVQEEFMNLFKNRHLPASTLHVYKDQLYLNATNEQNLMEILADKAINPDYGYISNLFQKYRDKTLGSSNGRSMFKHLEVIVKEYNNSDYGKAVLQEYQTALQNQEIVWSEIEISNKTLITEWK